MKKFSFSVFIVFLLHLCGCASVTPQAPGTLTDVYNPNLANAAKPKDLENWTINGRIAVVTPNQSNTANYYWRQQGNHYTMQFIAPLGAGSMRLSGSDKHVVLTNSKGQKYTAINADDLVRKHFGWRIPVNNLKYWVRGIAAPNSPAITRFDKNGDLAQLNQQGWSIQYLQYAKFKDYALPTKIFMNYGRVKLKLIITQWRV